MSGGDLDLSGDDLDALTGNDLHWSLDDLHISEDELENDTTPATPREKPTESPTAKQTTPLTTDNEPKHVTFAANTTKLVSLNPLWKIEATGSDLGKLDTPVDVEFLSNKHVIVSEAGNERLQVFDQQGRPTLTIQEDGLVPRGVAVNRYNSEFGLDVAVVDVCDKTLKFYAADEGAFLHQWKKSMFGSPSGVAVTAAGRYVVTDTHPNKESVGVYDEAGLLIRKFGTKTPANKKAGDDELRDPMYVAVDEHGRIIVSDWANHNVKVFDQSGRLLHTFGSYGPARGQMKFPCGVHVDYLDNIFVCDNGNHRVSLYGSSGKYIQDILADIDGLYFPEGVSVSNGGVLAVTENVVLNDVLRVYQT